MLTVPCNAVLQSVQGVPRIRSDLNPATWCVVDGHGCFCDWPCGRPRLDKSSLTCSGSMFITAERSAAWPSVRVKHLAEGHAGKCQQQTYSAQQPTAAALLPCLGLTSVLKEGGSHGCDSVTLKSQQLLTPGMLCCRMLEVTTPGMESQLGVNFAEYYNQSPLAK